MEVMDVKFLFVKKRFSTLGTPPMLSLRELLFGERQVFCLRGLSFFPVVFETGVVWRSFSPYQRMPFNGEPVKSEQISSGAFVTKRPGVESIQIELSPIPLPLPFHGFLGVHPFAVPERFVNHPEIQFSKDSFPYPNAQLVTPSPHTAIQLLSTPLHI